MNHLVLKIVALLCAVSLAAVAAVPIKKPNVIVIVADDLGYSDLGCYGSEIQTPNLDSLAGSGLRFTRFYNTARCWPSRAAILTGYYAQQVRRDTLPGMKSGTSGIRPVWARLLPEILRPLGYRSYHSGKWHLDGQPLKNGFDHSYSLNDHDRYFNPDEHTQDDKPLPAVKSDSGYYASTAIAQHAIEMLAGHRADHREQPFFLYLAFTAPHFPLQALPEDLALYQDRYQAGWDVLRQERFRCMLEMGLVTGTLPPLDPTVWPEYNPSEEELREKIGPGEVGRAIPWDSLTDVQRQFQPVKMAIHAAMVHRMDLEIGRVIAKLKTDGTYDNTLILFVSDNGASAEQIIRGDGNDRAATPGSAKSFLGLGPGWAAAANSPFRLYKSWTHEGGISTPLIAHWSNGIAAHGELRQTPGHLIDLAPTIVELAGGRWPTTCGGQPVPPTPGKSLLPVFAKEGPGSHDFFWWLHDDNRAIRMGDWKLVADHQKPWELYDLSQDRAETCNQAAGHPAKVKELEQEWTRHFEEIRTLATRDLLTTGVDSSKGKTK
jgi:arylsulfatase A-like enzyme